MKIGETREQVDEYFLPMLKTRGGLRAFVPNKKPKPTLEEAREYVAAQNARASKGPKALEWEIHRIRTVSTRERVE